MIIADHLVHAAVMIAVVVGNDHEVNRFDASAFQRSDRAFLGGAGVDQGRLALGRSNQDRVSLADVKGNRWTTSYDAGGRLTALADPAGGRTTYTYNASGKVRRAQDPGGRITTFTVDATSGAWSTLARSRAIASAPAS